MDSRFWRSGPRQERYIDSGGLHSWPLMAGVQKLTQKVCPGFIVSSHLHLRRDALAGGGEQSEDWLKFAYFNRVLNRGSVNVQ
ncbi:hypothetical protein TNIN_106681 [Trichonephila inaurata madagascariensis]|uniref:Uncharacterized protein n=1 Tax=Trichonephila inaurata madagascariensis TaxID=2747483 RepID=A0A8X7C608_9ARAC|nr:hypothetical protein TNIN_106681 [Trichonephila inaurata madagascariensis]